MPLAGAKDMQIQHVLNFGLVMMMPNWTITDGMMETPQREEAILLMRLGNFHQINLGFMICTGIFGSGWVMILMG